MTLSTVNGLGAIYYTTDGSTPTTSSPRYMQFYPIYIEANKVTTLKFFTIDNRGTKGAVKTETYYIGVTPQLFTLTVANSNPTGGTVTSNTGGIDCGTVCSKSYTSGTEVTLSTTPQNSYTFGGWTGDCTGMSLTCTLSMNAAKSVGVNFKANQTIIFGAAPSLVVGGIGTVSATGGASGNPVTFSSTTPVVCASGGTNGSSISGLAAGTCTIAANQAGNANYNPAPQVTQSLAVTVTISFTLTVNNLNLTGGTITSNTDGINCGTVCNKSYVSGTVVNLQASPRDDFMFSGWGGSCSGYANTCTLMMDAEKVVTANFDAFKKKRSPSWRGWLLSQ